nr:MAG TPA: hypothetical protein [Caudoviricetes sp.]
MSSRASGNIKRFREIKTKLESSISRNKKFT